MAQNRKVLTPNLGMIFLHPVAGALLGLQTGREVSIEIVFELVLDTQAVTIDQEFLTIRLDQCFNPVSPPIVTK